MILSGIPLILPAAGKSSRLGSPKGLQTHAGRTWLEMQCQSYAEAGGQVVALVLGYDAEHYLHALNVLRIDLPKPLSYGGCLLYLLPNPAPEYGPFSSLQEAASWCTDTTSFPAAFYLPIDTPLPAGDVLRQLALFMQPGVKVVEPRFKNHGGHPVLLSRDFLTEIAATDYHSPAARLDLQIRKQQNAGAVRSIPVNDPRVLLNLNDPEAWERYFDSAATVLLK